MFLYELDKAEELLVKYENSIVKEEIFFDDWMDGEYKSLISRILAQVIAAGRFMNYIHQAIINDEHSNAMRILGSVVCSPEYKTEIDLSPGPEKVFDDISSTIALHLIEQYNTCISFDRDELRRGEWTEDNYYNFKDLNRLMDTMCVLCDKVIEKYYQDHSFWMIKERERQDNLVWCPWDTDEIDYPWELEEDLYEGDRIEDIYPPLWVETL